MTFNRLNEKRAEESLTELPLDNIIYDAKREIGTVCDQSCRTCLGLLLTVSGACSVTR